MHSARHKLRAPTAVRRLNEESNAQPLTVGQRLRVGRLSEIEEPWNSLTEFRRTRSAHVEELEKTISIGL